MRYILLLLSCAAILLSPSSAQSQEVVISAISSDIEDYNNWLNNRKCFDLDGYQDPHATPATIQILIICKALHLGGMNADIVLMEMPNYSRGFFEAQKGVVAIPSDSIWLEQVVHSDFFVSPPVYAKGDFKKAFYALPSKRKAIESAIQLNKNNDIPVLQTLRNYSVVTSKLWIADLAALNQLGMTIIDTTKHKSMCRMVEYGRADLYFGEITMKSKKNLLLNCNEVTLEPIEGAKVTFQQSRHFVVSKKYPNSEKIFQALEKGLIFLRETGEIDQALYPLDKYRKKTDSWEELLPVARTP